MKKNFFLLIFLFIGLFFFLYYALDKLNYFDKIKLIKHEHKQLIKEYIFPYRAISQYKKKWLNLKGFQSKFEVKFYNDQKDIIIARMKDVKLSNNRNLELYNFVNGFYAGISNTLPGSGFIDHHQSNILILSSRGVLGYTKNIESDLNLKQIKHNIHEFINIEQFQKGTRWPWFSIKGFSIINNKVYVSYTEEISQNCWNTSIIYGDFNYDNIEFKKLFSPKQCINSFNIADKKLSEKNLRIDNEFNAHQSGGKIIGFDDNHILLSIGDYRSRYLGQEQDNEIVNGKIIKIDINTQDYEIISMGHRNPQGMFYDKEKEFILETEHGPMGGDEINLIEVNKLQENKTLNYGWPVVSAGEHYGGKIESNKIKYKKYPLHKSHKEYGFIEPLTSFVPSIGIGDITKIKENKYVVASLKDKSLYFFELNNKKKMINLERVEVFERVRDLKFNDGILYLFLEDTATIGILSFLK